MANLKAQDRESREAVRTKIKHPKVVDNSPPSLSQPAIMWYEGESCIGLPPMAVPPCPNIRLVVVWLDGPEGELE